MYLYCTYLSTVSSAAIYTSIIYLNRFHGSTIPGHHPHQPSTHPRATPAIIHSTQSHTLLQYHSLRSSINQSPSPPPNSFASLTTPFPPIPRLPRIAPVFPKSTLSVQELRKFEKKTETMEERNGSGRGWFESKERSLIRNSTSQNRGIRISKAAQAEN